MRLSDISPKAGKKCVFRLFLSLFWTDSQPHGFSTTMPFASINSSNPRTNLRNFHEIILCIGGAGKWGVFESAILNLFFQKFFVLFYLNGNKKPVHMRYHSFLHWGWFLQNLGKDFIWTNMHTTVKCFLRRPQNFTKSSSSIWRYLVSVKSIVKILSILVAFLENMNCKRYTVHLLMILHRILIKFIKDNK